MTPFFFALYAMWIPLSIASPWLFPYWWSIWAPSGEVCMDRIPHLQVTCDITTRMFLNNSCVSILSSNFIHQFKMVGSIFIVIKICRSISIISHNLAPLVKSAHLFFSLYFIPNTSKLQGAKSQYIVFLIRFFIVLISLPPRIPFTFRTVVKHIFTLSFTL